MCKMLLSTYKSHQSFLRKVPRLWGASPTRDLPLDWTPFGSWVTSFPNSLLAPPEKFSSYASETNFIRNLNIFRQFVCLCGWIDSLYRNRHADPEASAYFQRDKVGSSSEWYPHVHAPGTDGEPPRASSARRSGGAEADDIGRRLKAESEDWFVYDGPGDGLRTPETPRQRAVSPEVRRMQARATGNEMKQTLRMDDNVSTAAAKSTAS